MFALERAQKKMEARKTKKARTVGKGKLSGDVKKKQTEDCVEALLKFGLIEPDLWFVLDLVARKENGGHTLKAFLDLLDDKTAKSQSLFDEVGMEGNNWKERNANLCAMKPTKALLKEFMRILAFLVWKEVDGFAKAKEDSIVEEFKEMKKSGEAPSDALLHWMSGIRVADSKSELMLAVNLPELSVHLMNLEFGIHDGESLKEKVGLLLEFTDSHRLSKWVAVEHVVAVAKATLDLKETVIPSYEVDLMFHSPGAVQRKELVHLLKQKNLTDEEVERMMRKDALHGDCSYVMFVSYMSGWFEGMLRTSIEERKMNALMRACVFMEKGMEDVLKVDRILRFGHSIEFQEMADRCELPKKK